MQIHIDIAKSVRYHGRKEKKLFIHIILRHIDVLKPTFYQLNKRNKLCWLFIYFSERALNEFEPYQRDALLFDSRLLQIS